MLLGKSGGSRGGNGDYRETGGGSSGTIWNEVFISGGSTTGNRQ